MPALFFFYVAQFSQAFFSAFGLFGDDKYGIRFNQSKSGTTVQNIDNIQCWDKPGTLYFLLHIIS